MMSQMSWPPDLAAAASLTAKMYQNFLWWSNLIMAIFVNMPKEIFNLIMTVFENTLKEIFDLIMAITVENIKLTSNLIMAIFVNTDAKDEMNITQEGLTTLRRSKVRDTIRQVEVASRASMPTLSCAAAFRREVSAR